MAPVKVLLVGDPNGRLDALRKKVAAANSSKAGPFAACFCAGRLFADGGADDSLADDTPFAVRVRGVALTCSRGCSLAAESKALRRLVRAGVCYAVRVEFHRDACLLTLDRAP